MAIRSVCGPPMEQAKWDIHTQAGSSHLWLILGASFTINVVLTDRGSTWAFFSLPTRAWEFALGGLLASMAVRKVPSWCGLALGITGLAAIAYADLAFNDATSYPGTNALWPVAGAGLVILAGQMTDSSNPTVVMKMLGTRPMRWIGRLVVFVVSLALALHSPRGVGRREQQRLSSNRRSAGLAWVWRMSHSGRLRIHSDSIGR